MLEFEQYQVQIFTLRQRLVERSPCLSSYLPLRRTITMCISIRRLTLFTLLLGMMFGFVEPVQSQSDAEKIFGAIVQELERHSQNNQPRPAPNPRQPNPRKPSPNQPVPGRPGSSQGVWGSRWSNVPSNQTGNVVIKNKSNNPLRVGFARPNGGGTYVKTVQAHNTYRRTGLPLGTSVNLSRKSRNQQFKLSGASLTITVDLDGRMMAASTSLPPSIMPVLPNNVGALYVTNLSPRTLNLQITSPQGMGAWTDTVRPGGQWVRSDLAVHTDVTINGKKRRTVHIERGTQKIFVMPNGSFSSSSSGNRPWEPVFPIGQTCSVRITNYSGYNISASFFAPSKTNGKVRSIPSQQSIQEDRLPPGTQVSLSGGITNKTIVLSGSGLLQVEVMQNGNVRSFNANTDPTTPSRGNSIEIANRSGQSITASYGSRVREIRNRSGYTFAATPPGQMVRISGNGATASFVHRGQLLTVRARTNGQFDNLPIDSMVQPDAPAVTLTGHALVVNQSTMISTYTYQSPGSTPQSLTVGPLQTIPWRSVPAGTTMSLEVGASKVPTIIPANQWTSLVVSPQGKINLRSTSTRHEPEMESGALEPDLADDLIPTPDELLPNPDPPSNNDPLPTKIAANGLPTPNVTPLVDWVVTNFSRKTMGETKELLDLLDAASINRIDAIAKELKAASIDSEVAIQNAKQGKLPEIASFVAGLPSTQSARFQEELNDLNKIATLRTQLIPLKAKLESGAASASLKTHVSAIALQASNLGNAGLTAAMKRIRRDLSIQDTLLRGLETTGLEPAQLALPKGEVSVIAHPWVKPGNSYFASTGLVLTDSADGLIMVSKMSAEDALQLPVDSNGNRVPETNANTVSSMVIISNPESNRSTLQFSINKKNYSLAAGKQQSLPVGPSYLIEFRRGSEKEQAKFDVSKPGIYTFGSNNEGWSLAKQKIVMRVSNPVNGVTLNYLIDGKPESLTAGSTALHDSSQPVLLTFDQGEGFGTKNKLVSNSGEFYFAIDSDTGYWDLYAGLMPEQGKPSGQGKTSGEVLRIERPTLNHIKNSAGNSLFDFSLLTPSTGDLIEDLR